jgi:hypothetical protein
MTCRNWARVDQRQRLVLDQVAVDAADRERSRHREPMDPGLSRDRKRILGRWERRLGQAHALLRSPSGLAGTERA